MKAADATVVDLCASIYKMPSQYTTFLLIERSEAVLCPFLQISVATPSYTPIFLSNSIKVLSPVLVE